MSPLLKMALDLGPLLIFFAANMVSGIFTATAVFMVAITISIATTFAIERKISPMPVLTCALVLIFGGLTLWLSNENFIKIKPTILYAMFSAVLVGGLAFNRLFIKYLLGQIASARRSRVARADMAMVGVLLGTRDHQRIRLAQHLHGHVGRFQSVGRVSDDAPLCAVTDAVHRAPSNRRRQVAARDLKGATNRVIRGDGAATLLRRLRNFAANLRSNMTPEPHQIVKFAHDPLAAALKEVNVAAIVRRVRTNR